MALPLMVQGVPIMSGGVPALKPDAVSCCCKCCPPLSTTLTVTFNNTSNCAGIDGKTLTLTYSTITGKWSGSGALGCGDSVTMDFYCSDESGPANGPEDFRMDFDFTSCTTSPSGSVHASPTGTPVCDPLNVVFNIGFDTSGCGCCTDGAGRTFTATVTL